MTKSHKHTTSLAGLQHAGLVSLLCVGLCSVVAAPKSVEASGIEDWEFGASLDFVTQENASLGEDAHGAGIGFIVGRYFRSSDPVVLGGQLQYTNKVFSSIEDSSDVALRSTGLFATAQLARFPYVQLKFGVANSKYEDIEGTATETGPAYGVGIVGRGRGPGIHIIDYQVIDLGPDRARVFSVNLLIFLCLLGGGC